MKQFINVLANGNNFKDYFFECPPISQDLLSKKLFEFVIKNADSELDDRKVDKEAFAEYFNPNTASVTFLNLGKDSKLVAPNPLDKENLKSYGHLAIFVRNGASEQVEEFWKNSAKIFLEEVQARGSKPVWLSTAGQGIAWLHLRMDSRPKYYQTQEYKRF